MDQSTGTLTTNETNPTQHAMVIVWGHFARTIGLLAQLAQVPIAQKAVIRAPSEKLVELLLGLLTGIEYLTDLSEGAAAPCEPVMSRLFRCAKSGWMPWAVSGLRIA